MHIGIHFELEFDFIPKRRRQFVSINENVRMETVFVYENNVKKRMKRKGTGSNYFYGINQSRRSSARWPLIFNEKVKKNCIEIIFHY